MANLLLVERYHLLPSTMPDRLSGAGWSPTNKNLGWTWVTNTSSLGLLAGGEKVATFRATALEATCARLVRAASLSFDRVLRPARGRPNIEVVAVADAGES